MHFRVKHKEIFIGVFILFFGLSNTAFTQVEEPDFFVTLEGDTLRDPDPINQSSEYQMIILDGDTLLRSKVTKELYNRQFVKVDVNRQPLLKNDWMSQHWNTEVQNPYEKKPVSYPFSLDFGGQKFTMPIDGPITSRYGWRRGRAHKGIDIDLKTGDNVRVVMDGKVRFARYYGGLGKVVIVRHYNGLETYYAHLSKILVQPNTTVYSGQVIGKGGNTGRSRGSHLHFEARWFNESINPEYLFDLANKTGIRSSTIYVDSRWTDPRKHRSYKQSNIAIQTRPLMAINSNPAAAPKETLKKAPSNSGLSRNTTTNNTLQREVVHIVSKGDTLAKIANVYGKTIEAICNANGISKSSALKIGQRLTIR